MLRHLQGQAYDYDKLGSCRETIKQKVNKLWFQALRKSGKTIGLLQFIDPIINFYAITRKAREQENRNNEDANN